LWLCFWQSWPRISARPDVGQSAHQLQQRARAVRREPDWHRRIRGGVKGSAPRAFVDPIAAGEQVVASQRSATWAFLHQQYSDAVAVEMEGSGFLTAAHANQQVRALVIRGISDLVNNKKTADAAGWQKKASRHAAAFAFEVL